MNEKQREMEKYWDKEKGDAEKKRAEKEVGSIQPK